MSSGLRDSTSVDRPGPSSSTISLFRTLRPNYRQHRKGHGVAGIIGMAHSHRSRRGLRISKTGGSCQPACTMAIGLHTGHAIKVPGDERQHLVAIVSVEGLLSMRRRDRRCSLFVRPVSGFQVDSVNSMALLYPESVAASIYRIWRTSRRVP